MAFGPDGSLYAGGFFTKAGGASASNIARWNGSAWSPLGSGMDTPVNALALGSDGSLYAGGTFSTAGNTRADYFGQWTAAVGRCDLAVDVPGMCQAE